LDGTSVGARVGEDGARVGTEDVGDVLGALVGTEIVGIVVGAEVGIEEEGRGWKMGVSEKNTVRDFITKYGTSKSRHLSPNILSWTRPALKIEIPWDISLMTPQKNRDG
jgi:hypothetical protein